MRQRKWIALPLGVALLLSLAACSGRETGATPAPASTPEQTEGSAAPETEETAIAEGDTLSVSFTFRNEQGETVQDGTVRISDGTVEETYPTGTEGTFTVGGLPREGSVTVTLLDGGDSELGSVELQFTEGSVTDAAAQEDGTVRVSAIPETDNVSLMLAPDGQGGLTCALKLAETA